MDKISQEERLDRITEIASKVFPGLAVVVQVRDVDCIVHQEEGQPPVNVAASNVREIDTMKIIVEHLSSIIEKISADLEELEKKSV